MIASIVIIVVILVISVYLYRWGLNREIHGYDYNDIKNMCEQFPAVKEKARRIFNAKGVFTRADYNYLVKEYHQEVFLQRFEECRKSLR